VKGFKQFCISSALEGTDGGDMLWNDIEGGNVRSDRKMSTLTVKMETVTLIANGRYDLICFVYYVYAINSKIFLLGRHFIFWGSSQIQVNTFPLGRHVLLEGHLRLESSCIQLNMV
jgi:hypothetical protein